MAVHDFSSGHGTEHLVQFIGEPSECFLCSERLAGRIVYWHGSHTIFLHPECAKSLGCHLIGDAMRATKPATVGQIIDWPEVRRRLHQEGMIAYDGNHRPGRR